MTSLIIWQKSGEKKIIQREIYKSWGMFFFSEQKIIIRIVLLYFTIDINIHDIYVLIM